MQDFLLVAFGAVFGSNIRFLISQKLEKINLNKNLIIIFINTLSSFFLGLFSSFVLNTSPLNFSHQWVLFFSIGFLGSLSTFSSFIYHLFELLLQFKFFRALKLMIISLALGIISLAFGFFLGNQ